MATRAQRATAIVEALLNKVPTQQQVARVVNAFAQQGPIGMSVELTNAQKLEIFLRSIRQLVLDRVRNAEANTQVEALRQQIFEQANTDFAETEEP